MKGHCQFIFTWLKYSSGGPPLKKIVCTWICHIALLFKEQSLDIFTIRWQPFETYAQSIFVIIGWQGGNYLKVHFIAFAIKYQCSLITVVQNGKLKYFKEQCLKHHCGTFIQNIPKHITNEFRIVTPNYHL